MTRETVPCETPATLATSRIVDFVFIEHPIDKKWKLSYICIITFPHIHVNTLNRCGEQLCYCDTKPRFIPLYRIIERDQ